MRCAILYFSATGNTRRAISIVEREMAAAGNQVEVYRLSRDRDSLKPLLDAGFPRGYDLFVVAFPVLSFGAPDFVRRAVKALPRGDATGARLRAATLAVDGGGGITAAAGMTRLLEGRGYSVFLSSRAAYPDNWVQMMDTPNPTRAEEMTVAGDAFALSFAQDLVAGRAREPGANRRVSPLFSFINLLFRNRGRRLLGKLFYADGDCDGCGLCARLCPSGTIALAKAKGARPRWKFNCENCNACMNACPRRAINSSWGRLLGFAVISTALCLVGIWAWFGPARPIVGSALTAALPQSLGPEGSWSWLSDIARIALDAIVVALVLIYIPLIPAWPLDYLLGQRIQGLPVLRKMCQWTWTKGFRRYAARAIEKKS